MGWDVLLLPDALPIVFGNLGLLGLAGILLYFGHRHRPSVVFALFLVTRALLSFVSVLREFNVFATGYEDPAAAALWAKVTPYVVIPVPILLLYLLLVYPRPRMRWLRSSWSWVPFAVAIVALEFFAGTPHLWHEETTEFGPVAYLYTGALSFVLLSGMNFLYGAATLVFALDAYRSKPGPQRQTLTIISLGFMLPALFSALGSLNGLVFEGSIYNYGATYLNIAAVVPALGAGALMVAAAIASPDASFKGAAKRYLLLCILPVFLQVFLVVDAQLNTGTAIGTLAAIPIGIFRLAMPLLVCYALLRHGLFDIDLRVKGTLRTGTVAGIFGGALFILAESIEQRLPLDDWQAGIMAAAAIGLFLSPIHVLSVRLAETLMPGVSRDEDYLTTRRKEVYRSALERALKDGVLTPREEAILAKVRRELGLTVTQAKQIREGMIQEAAA